MIPTLLVTSLLPSPGAPGALEFQAELRPKAYRTWSIELPRDPFRAVGGSIPIPHANGDGFAVEARGVGLAIDTDGDGEIDRVVEGREDAATGVRSARLVLSGETPDGAAFRYPVRLTSAGDGWKWATGGALVGELDGTEIAVVDMDGNGRHGDVGTDAIVVGGGGAASYLGETIVLGDTLYRLVVDGGTVRTERFEGPQGTLDLLGEFDGKGLFLNVVVRSTDGKHSFELSGAEDGLTVPAGEYRLEGAVLGLGESRVTADTSGMAPFDVTSDADCAPAWGAPIKASFAYGRDGDKLVLDPADVRYVGAAGERWVGWDPAGKSPTFAIQDETTGDTLIDVVFPGSC